MMPDWEMPFFLSHALSLIFVNIREKKFLYVFLLLCSFFLFFFSPLHFVNLPPIEDNIYESENTDFLRSIVFFATIFIFFFFNLFSKRLISPVKKEVEGKSGITEDPAKEWELNDSMLIVSGKMRVARMSLVSWKSLNIVI